MATLCRRRSADFVNDGLDLNMGNQFTALSPKKCKLTLLRIPVYLTRFAGIS